MDVTFSRGSEIGRERRTIPADLYNRIHTEFARCREGHLFVPIRAMQYLAVIDCEEIVFVDGQGPRVIEISWREFHPGRRDDLRAPVPFTCVYYTQKGIDIMPRLHTEFGRALERLEERRPAPDDASVSRLPRRD